MGVERKTYKNSLENFKKLKDYIKKLKNGRTKINRQECTNQPHRDR
jgi:hypothetical protein